MKKFFFILTVISLPFFMACNSSDDDSSNDNPKGVSGNRLPTEFIGPNNTLAYKIFYDDNNKIDKIESYGWGSHDTGRVKFEYDSQGNISKLKETWVDNGVESEPWVYTIAYINANKTQITAESEVYTFNLDTDGKLVSYIESYSDTNRTYALSYDSKANCSSVVSSDSWRNTFFAYTYDDKKGLFSAVNGLPSWLIVFLRNTESFEESSFFCLTYVNNPVKWDYSTSLGAVEHGDIQYDYDTDGYPVKVKVSITGSGSNTDPIDCSIKYIDAK
jgi:hypothetical protein